VQAGPDRAAIEDESLASERGERQRRRSRTELVAARQRRHHRLVEQRTHRKIGALADRRPDKSDIERLRPQSRDQLNRAALLEGQGDPRMSFAERTDRTRHKRVERRRTGKSESDAAGLTARRLLGRRDRVANPGQDRLGLGEKGAAGRGQLDAARLAVKKPRIELALQCLDLLRQRRLLNTEPLGRAGNMTLLGDSDKITEMAQFHI
jgi:hypothetical protein